MSIKRFFAKTTSEALRKVRDTLGPESVILSNRSVDGGIEILALEQDAITAMLPPCVPKEGGAAFPLQIHHKSEAAEPGEPARNIFKRPEKVDTDAGPISRQPDGYDSYYPRGAGQDQHSNLAETLNRAALAATSNFAGVPHQSPDQVMLLSAAPGQKSRSPVNLAEAPRRVETDNSSNVSSNNSRSGIKRRNARKPEDRTETGSAKKKRSTAFDARGLADDVASTVLREIKLMRGAMDQQLGSLLRSDREPRGPILGPLFRQLLMTGFSNALAHELLDHLPPLDGEKNAISHMKSTLAGKLKTIAHEREILEKGGVYALVGPTGVGKTTTTAKLAARCVVRHGADKLALLTTDGYRIGGHEQLRIYGKILGVTVHAVRDTQDLALVLGELRGKHMVLIDTGGVGQRDPIVAEQTAMFAGCGTEVKRLLLLNAASSAHALNEVAQAYRGDGLAGAIITKVDEAVIMGCALDTAIRHSLPLYYIAQGQRVPEDLELADPANLANFALDNLAQDLPFAVPDDGFPLPSPNGTSGYAEMDTGGAVHG